MAHTLLHHSGHLPDRRTRDNNEKWSARRTVLFCVAACGAFWLTAFFLLNAIF